MNDDRRHEEEEVVRRRRQERINRVAELRKQGKSQRQIAEDEGISRTQVQEDLKAASTGQGGWPVEPEDGKVTGKDGRTRRAKPRKTPRQKAAEEALAALNNKNEHAAEEPSEPLELFDQAGEQVPPQAHEAFNQMPEIRELSLACDRLAKEVQRVSKLAVGRCMQVSTILSQIKAVKQNINGSKPAYVCPYCKGEKKECRACAGHGWVVAVTWKQAPPEMKESKKGGAK
jgi:hypothetical protein